MKKMPLIISMLVILTALFIVSCDNSPKINIYTVTFDSDGGSKVDPVTVEEGNKVTKPADPTKQGFSFEGWLDSAGKVFDFDTKITSSITLKAQWSAIKKTYTVTFDSDGGSKVDPVTVEEGNKVAKPEDPEKEGYAFEGWLDSADKAFDFDTKINSSITLKAKWAEYHNVTFDSNGGSHVDAQKVADGKYAALPESPVMDGYDFRGWFKDGEMYSFDENPVTSDITLKARWTDSAKYYFITFDSNGGSEVETQKVKEGDKVSKPSNPEKEGYYFDYWTLNGWEYNFNALTTSNLTLVAKWKECFYIIFDSAGGSAVDAEPVEKGTKAVKPEDPKKGNDIFDGWYDADNKKFNFDTDTVNANITLIAHWTEACKVTFDTNGGTEVEPQIVAKGKTAAKPDTTKVGYVLDKWVTEDGNTFEFDTEITSDITLKAIWAKSGVLTVSFNSNGGSTVDSQTVEIWGKAEKPADPTKAGSYFVCWVLGSTVFDFDNELISTNITLDALWNTAKYYTVTFDTEGGSYVPLQRVRENDKANQPKSPTKTGYIFQCWTTDDGREFSFNTSITSDTILSARWKRYTHYVAFDTTGGTDVITETIGDGETAFRPVNPSCSDPHKTFSHWELDGKEYDFTAPVTKNITLKAVWRDYKVGEIGPAGGYIFYDCDADNADGNKDGLISTECGWRYLEAAKDDYYETTHWGDSSGDNYGTKYDVGAGRDNTIKLKNQGKKDFMVYKIWGKEFYGYSDWFVPSRDELNLMYENLHKKGLGSFRNDRYWTSCEYFDEDGAHSYYYACYQDFATGKKDGHLRTADDYLRLIRSF